LNFDPLFGILNTMPERGSFSLLLNVARAGLAGSLALSSLPAFGCASTENNNIQRSHVGTPRPQPQETPRIIPDLRLNLDKNKFWEAVGQPLNFGMITDTPDKNKMNCLKPLGDFCISEATKKDAMEILGIDKEKLKVIYPGINGFVKKLT